MSGNPSAVEADLQWATGAINHGRPDDAERFARNVLARIPQHPKALYLLGCALLQQNRAAQAVASLEKAARAAGAGGGDAARHRAAAERAW